MPAPADNTNALIWTISKTEDLLHDVAKLTEDDSCYYLGHALGRLGTSMKQWRRLRLRYKDDEELIDRMDNIEQRFESRLLIGSLVRRFHAGSAQLILRNHHGFQTGNGAVASQQEEKEPYRPPYILLSGDRTIDL